AVLLNEVVQVVQNLALELREREHGILQCFLGWKLRRLYENIKRRSTAGVHFVQPAAGGRSMSSRLTIGVFLLMCGVSLGAPQTTGVTEQQADTFTKK